MAARTRTSSPCLPGSLWRVATADMICTEAQYVDALAAHVKEKGNFPPMHNDALMENYPGLYQSLLQIIHNTGERVNRRMEIQNQK